MSGEFIDLWPGHQDHSAGQNLGAGHSCRSAAVDFHGFSRFFRSYSEMKEKGPSQAGRGKNLLRDPSISMIEGKMEYGSSQLLLIFWALLESLDISAVHTFLLGPHSEKMSYTIRNIWTCLTSSQLKDVLHTASA